MGPTTRLDEPLNVAARLSAMAARLPDATAVVEPLGYDRAGRRRYRTMSFRELDRDSDRIARGLRRLGAVPGTTLAIMIRPGVDFVSLVFGLFKAGAVAVLVDPGMGRRRLVECLGEVEPDGFIAIPVVQAIRLALRRRFRRAWLNVTVGRRWFWGGPTLDTLRGEPWSQPEMAPTRADDPAAIIFTSGGTGPPKGVLYCHRTFDAQVDQLREFYGIEPGEVDLPGFPLFGLFNCALGATAVIPDMDPSHPARVDPRKILEAVEDWNVTQTFGSPAIWDRVGRYCERTGRRLSSVRRVFSAGAPVPAEVLRRMTAAIHAEGTMHTPYGATEALPVASIDAAEVLGQTAERARQGAGVCVGRRFPGIAWRVIRIVDGPIHSIADAESLAPGEIGELIVSGPVVTQRYVTRREANALAKIADEEGIWHRMGDAGYLDDQERFWFCGRVVHRVLTPQGPMYPVCCEAIFNEHPSVRRSALVGVGPPGRQRPVIVLEPRAEGTARRAIGRILGARARRRLIEEARAMAAAHPLTASIDTFLVHPRFPVDVRHNAKISRERLAAWAARKLARSGEN